MTTDTRPTAGIKEAAEKYARLQWKCGLKEGREDDDTATWDNLSNAACDSFYAACDALDAEVRELRDSHRLLEKSLRNAMNMGYYDDWIDDALDTLDAIPERFLARPDAAEGGG